VLCTIFRWFARFQEVRGSLEDDPRPGRPVPARSSENVKKARAIVMQDKRIAIRVLAERLGVGKEAARKILERYFQK
jgi:transposase